MYEDRSLTDHMDFIKLNCTTIDDDGAPLKTSSYFVNINNISIIARTEDTCSKNKWDKSAIKVEGAYYTATESPEEILELIKNAENAI